MSQRNKIRLSVGQLAEIFELNEQTLRFYEKKGVFVPAGRLQNGYRYYTIEQLPQLYALLTLRQAGLSLEEARLHNSSESLEQNLDRWKIRENSIQKQVDMLVSRKIAIGRLRSMASEGLARRGEYSIALMGRISTTTTAVFNTDETGSPPEYHTAMTRRLLRWQNQGLIGFPVFGARIGLEKVLAGNCDPPDELIMIWGQPESVIDDADVEARILEPGPWASVFFQGSYEYFAGAYRSLLDYIEAEGFIPCGESLELSYLDDFTSTNPRDYVTRIMLPLASGRRSTEQLACYENLIV